MFYSLFQIPDDQHNIEVRVAVMGNADAGKSTLIGVLTQGQLDSGRGSARLNMFRHLHEIQSGRTSSISHEILGFNSKVTIFIFLSPILFLKNFFTILPMDGSILCQPLVLSNFLAFCSIKFYQRIIICQLRSANFTSVYSM